MTARPLRRPGFSAFCLLSSVSCLLFVVFGLRSSAAGAGTELRGVEGLARAYDYILEARFDQVEAELRRACGPAPAEACDVLDVTAQWWRILLDPENRERDEAFGASVDRAIARTEAWTVRAPKDAEAWFYLGAAYAVRVQWRVLRDEKLSAARDGKRIRQALEEAVSLDPSMDDAYFGIGMYKYYADVAPTAARILRFLMLLPGGDREEGLAEMLRARNRGRLLQGEADYQLHVVYLWYEQDVPRALGLLQGLHEHYPANPHFLAQIADIQDRYQHDITASLASWRALLAAGREQRVNAAALAETQARLGIARQLEALHQTDHAIEQLEAVVAAKATAPYGSLALAQLRLGEALDRMGRREAALAAYRAAVAAAPDPDPDDVRETATAHIRRTPNANRARAYRLSLDGFRRLEQGDLPAAQAALEQSLALHPADPVARYRIGRVLLAQKDDGAALAQFELAIAGARACPAPILGTAYLEAARLHERATRLPTAISYYRRAAALFGAAADTRASATRALTRLRATTR
jgi:tetratricopeptide (TPR) repeat protein